jgi:hypothetical protein
VRVLTLAMSVYLLVAQPVENSQPVAELATPEPASGPVAESPVVTITDSIIAWPHTR